ncbi:MAG: ATP-binding protein [Bacteriovoracia bacterium]
MSTILTRYLTPFIVKDLQKKMVFLGGPRQIGKTTLSQSLLPEGVGYYNWDFAEDRTTIRNCGWPRTQKLIVLDEVHKLRGWRNLIKGYFDKLKHTHQFLVTGSARLDHFRRGGDSLLGRYHYYRLHPLSFSELGNKVENLHTLLTFGGFPEPFLAQDAVELKRWHRARVAKLVSTDLRELETVIEIDKIELLAEELPNRVGSPLSVRNLALDLEIDPKTAKRWLEMLDSLYYCFQIAPYGTSKIRAVKKEQKLYLWDWSQVTAEGARFENMVACHLLKYCHFHEDVYGEKLELRYIRDVNKREIDFVVLKNRTPLFAVEVKLSFQALDPSIPYFFDRLRLPKVYQVHLGDQQKQVRDEIVVCSFAEFCKLENLV